MSAPRDGSSRERAIPRPGARAVVLDPAGRVLLVRSEFDGRVMWFTPGGQVDAGETPEEAALRELREEVGLDGVALGPRLWHRHAVWHWETRDLWLESEEWFFLVRLREERPDLRTRVVDDGIVRLHEARWWSLDDLRASGEPTSPRALCDLLEPLLRGEVPAEPVEIGL